jgi:hypothetical protein
VFSYGTAAIADDGSTKIQRYYGGYPADNAGSALHFVIRNIKGEAVFVGRYHANVVSVRVHHGASLPGHSYARMEFLLRRWLSVERRIAAPGMINPSFCFSY